MKYQLAVPLVVFACAIGATVAYERATPSEPQREQGPAPQFERLTVEDVGRLANANAAIYAQRIELARLRRGGRVAATGWVRSLPLGGEKTTVAARGATATATKDWLDGIPSSFVEYTPTAVRVLGELDDVPAAPASADPGDAPTVPPVQVTGDLKVRLRQGTGEPKEFERRLVITLVRQSTAPERWVVTGASLRGRTGLASYDDPVVVRQGSVDVVAEEANRGFAAATARQADATLRDVRRRFPLVDGPEAATFYVLPGRGRVPILFDEATAELPLHPTGWTYDTGDVVLLWDELRASAPIRRMGIVRHEAVHVGLLPLLDRAPTLLFEGVATYEETRGIEEGSTLSIDLRPLRAAFRERELGYQGLLASSDADFGRDTDEGVQLGYLASYATTAFIVDEYGYPKLQRLLTLIEDGVDTEDALDRVLRLSPIALERRVRVWTAQQLSDGPAQAGATRRHRP